MNSPRPSSETSTSTLAEQDQPLLIEQFTIDSSSAFKQPPQTSHPRLNDHIPIIRFAILVLNFLVIPIPIFGAPDTLIPLLPMTFGTTFLTWIPVAVTMSAAQTSKNIIKTVQNGEELGSRRSAILVEDPITGEEKWMLEPKKEVKPMGRNVVFWIDIFCMVVFLDSIILSLVFGRQSPKTLAGVVVVRSVTVLLLFSVIVMEKRCETKSVGGGDDLEAEVTPKFCERTE